LGVSVFVNAGTYEYVNNTTNTECSLEEPGSLHHITFQGVLEFYETTSGAPIITCKPPLLEDCYTLWWSIYSAIKFVRLNDVNQTEIDVTSDPVITTDENGVQTHTFTR
jgi:hypothetical protein